MKRERKSSQCGWDLPVGGVTFRFRNYLGSVFNRNVIISRQVTSTHRKSNASLILKLRSNRYVSIGYRIQFNLGSCYLRNTYRYLTAVSQRSVITIVYNASFGSSVVGISCLYHCFQLQLQTECTMPEPYPRSQQ